MTVFLLRAARCRIGEPIKSVRGCPLLTRILDIRTRAKPNEIALGIPRTHPWNAYHNAACVNLIHDRGFRHGYRDAYLLDPRSCPFYLLV
jgi:hypothetical protein